MITAFPQTSIPPNLVDFRINEVFLFDQIVKINLSPPDLSNRGEEYSLPVLRENGKPNFSGSNPW